MHLRTIFSSMNARSVCSVWYMRSIYQEPATSPCGHMRMHNSMPSNTSKVNLNGFPILHPCNSSLIIKIPLAATIPFVDDMHARKPKHSSMDFKGLFSLWKLTLSHQYIGTECRLEAKISAS